MYVSLITACRVYAEFDVEHQVSDVVRVCGAVSETTQKYFNFAPLTSSRDMAMLGSIASMSFVKGHTTFGNSSKHLK